LERGGAAVAALLVACDPILLASSSLVMTETLATFLTTAGLFVLTWAEERRASGGWAILPHLAAGVVLGLAALCRPAFLLWAIAAFVMLWWRSFRGRREGDSPIFAETKIGTVPNSRGPTGRGRFSANLRVPIAFVLGVLVVLSPWAIRNEFQFDRPIATTTHGGYTLSLANNPQFYDWLRHAPWGSVWKADRFNSNWDSRRPRDELQADQVAYAEAWQTIRSQPGTFLLACVVRVGRFWSPLPHQLTANETPLRRLSRYAVGLWYLAEFMFALLGIWRFLRWALKCPALPSSSWHWGLLLVVCLLAGHVVYWTDMRMRAPIMPVVAICAAAGLACRRSDDNAVAVRRLG
jgi:hypothetical protein